MLRALFLIFALGVGVVLVVPTWEPERKALTLRLRTGDEIREAVRAGARRRGAEVLDLAEGEESPSQDAMPSVSAGPPSGPSEEVLRPGEAEQLDELVEEALREE